MSKSDNGVIILDTPPTGACLFVKKCFSGQASRRLRLTPGKVQFCMFLQVSKEWEWQIEISEGAEMIL